MAHPHQGPGGGRAVLPPRCWPDGEGAPTKTTITSSPQPPCDPKTPPPEAPRRPRTAPRRGKTAASGGKITRKSIPRNPSAPRWQKNFTQNSLARHRVRDWGRHSRARAGPKRYGFLGKKEVSCGPEGDKRASAAPRALLLAPRAPSPLSGTVPWDTASRPDHAGSVPPSAVNVMSGRCEKPPKH